MFAEKIPFGGYRLFSNVSFYIDYIVGRWLAATEKRRELTKNPPRFAEVCPTVVGVDVLGDPLQIND